MALVMAPYVLPHRIILTCKAKYASTTKEQIIAEAIGQVRVPT